MDWAKDLEKLGPLILSLVFGFGISLYIGSVLYGALPVGPGSNAINTIISTIGTELTTFFPIIIIVVFLALVYLVARGSGMLGGSGKGKK